MPLLQIDYSHGKPTIEPKKRGQEVDLQQRIHAFDPSNASMPEYSLKYKNEPNVGTVRHLLGGTGCINQQDIRSSTVHWQLGLRAYEKLKQPE